LIIATAAGVEAGPHVAGDLSDPSFDGRVHVLVAGPEGQGARRQLLAHPVQGGDQDLGVVLGQEAGCG
jgi:hypothetical protein